MEVEGMLVDDVGCVVVAVNELGGLGGRRGTLFLAVLSLVGIC